MTTKVKIITTGFVVLCLGGILTYSIKKYNSKQVSPPARDEVFDEDLKVLTESKTATPFQVYAALVRLAQVKNKVAYEEALRRHRDTQPWIRAGAGLALSYFATAEADRLLQELVNDADPLVREKVIEGLTANELSEERQRIFSVLLADEKRTPGEVIQLKIALLKKSTDIKLKEDLLKDIFAVLQKMPPEKRIHSIQQLVAAESRNETLGHYLRQLLQSEKSSPELTAAIVNSLSITQPEKIRNELPTYIRSPHESVRLAAVNGFLYSCPPGVIDTLADLIKNDKSEQVVKSSLQVLSGFPREESRAIFKSLEGKKLSPSVSFTYAQAYKAFEMNKGKDPCIK